MSSILDFEVSAPPFSINKAYYLKSFSGKNATKIRTVECRDWGNLVLLGLQSKKQEMLDFRASFDDKKNAIAIYLTFEVPKKKFYTAAGHISAHSSDITNIEKLLVDIIFDERFDGRSLDGKVMTNININDKFISRMYSEKVASSGDYKIKISVHLIANGRE